MKFLILIPQWFDIGGPYVNTRDMLYCIKGIPGDSARCLVNGLSTKKTFNDPDYESVPFDSDDALRIVDEYDAILVSGSVGRKAPEKIKSSFYNLIKYAHEHNKKVIYLEITHFARAIKRCSFQIYEDDETERPYEDFYDYVDLVVTFNRKDGFIGDIANPKGIKLHDTLTLEDGLTNIFAIDFEDRKKKFWKDFSEKLYRSVHFIGRFSPYKGPWLVRDLHREYLQKNNYITFIEGADVTIGTVSQIYKDLKSNPRVDRDDLICVTQAHKDRIEKFRNNEFVFERNKPAYVLPEFKNEEGLERVSKSMFGIELLKLKKPQDYETMIETVILEFAAVGSIPIYRKIWGENFTILGKKFIEFDQEETGTILLDDENPQAAVDLMNKLSDDKVMYDEWRKNAYDFYYKYFDTKNVFYPLISKIKEKLS